MIYPTGKANNSGVTLVELCIVGVILSLMFTIGWPVFSRMARKTQAGTALSEITSTLRYARDTALNEGKCYRVKFDSQAFSYRLSVKSEANEFIELSDSIFNARKLPAGLHWEHVSANEVIFLPDGTSGDFEISIKNSQGDISTLKLQGSTGRIDIK